MRHRGMMKAIPKDEWVSVLSCDHDSVCRGLMKVWARSVPLEEYASNRAGQRNQSLRSRQPEVRRFDFQDPKGGKVCTT